jgi:hypothetical protein
MFALAQLSSCMSYMNSSMLRTGSEQLLTIVCSILFMSVKHRDENIQFFTFPIPLLPNVEDVFDLSLLLLDDPVGDPRYISFFFLTPGVANEVVFATLLHFEHRTIVVVMRRL